MQDGRAKTKARFFKFIIALIIAVLSVPVFSYGQAYPKIIDLSNQVSPVTQRNEYWCVYACLQAVSSQDQCEHCFHYLDQYISHFYVAQINPYPPAIMSDSAYTHAMNHLIHNYSTPCCGGEEYANFGVVLDQMPDFIGYEMKYPDFFTAISEPFINVPKPLFCVRMSDGTGHCVLYIGSEIYSQDVEDPRSSVRIMDPFWGQELTMPCKDFFYKYWDYYLQW